MADPVAATGGLTLSGALLPIAIGGGLIVARSVAEVSSRLGFPAILGVLVLGIGLGVPLNNNLVSSSTVETLHLLALAMLLFYAGLSADIASIRRILVYGLLLALVGVIVSSLALGLLLFWAGSANAGAIHLGFDRANGIPLGVALLVASCVGSTDAGATFSVLRTVRDRLSPTLTNTLEFESSVNDPTAILFFGLVSGLFFQAGGGAETETTAMVMAQFGNFSRLVFSGVVMGFITSFAARFAVAQFNDEESQLIVIIATVMAVYGITSFFGGSGLLAAYVCGVILNRPYEDSTQEGHNDPKSLQRLLAPVNSLAEYVIFLLLGVLVDWTTLWDVLPLAALTALSLNLVCRPLSVWLLARYSPLSKREAFFLSWCGIRGAVPLALAFELSHEIANLQGVSATASQTLATNCTALIFDVVLISLVVQGSTLAPLAKWLGIENKQPPLTSPSNEIAV
jgi:cell volume regulation protein A